MSTTGTGTAAPVVSLSDWTLNMPTDKVETTSLEDSNKTYVQGHHDVSGTFSGFWDDTEDTLFDGRDSADGVKMYIYPATNAASKYFYGPAWVDVSVTGGVRDATKVSGTFSANGSWGRQ